MNLQFSKEVLNDKVTTDVKISEQVRRYKLFSESHAVIGQFVFHHEEQFLMINNRRIEARENKGQHLLIDIADNSQIGEYKVADNSSFSSFSYTAFNTSIIEIGEQVYKFQRLRPDTPSSIFKQETWGHFKFKLFPAQGKEFAEFSLKMDIPVFSKANYTKYRFFTGSIETTITDALALLAAFYLMGIEFDKKDNRD